jgi:hypothetical protein
MTQPADISSSKPKKHSKTQRKNFNPKKRHLPALSQASCVVTFRDVLRSFEMFWDDCCKQIKPHFKKTTQTKP